MVRDRKREMFEPAGHEKEVSCQFADEVLLELRAHLGARLSGGILGPYPGADVVGVGCIRVFIPGGDVGRPFGPPSFRDAFSVLPLLEGCGSQSGAVVLAFAAAERDEQLLSFFLTEIFLGERIAVRLHRDVPSIILIGGTVEILDDRSILFGDLANDGFQLGGLHAMLRSWCSNRPPPLAMITRASQSSSYSCARAEMSGMVESPRSSAEICSRISAVSLIARAVSLIS